MKTILIAVPTNKYIEPETMKSIYDLEIPEGYKTEFQFFFGYSRSQVKNLISDWSKSFDYTIIVYPDCVLDKSIMINYISSNVDIIASYNKFIIAHKNVFTEILHYPHFITSETDINEVQDFLNRVTLSGGSVDMKY